jgi:dihydroxy-acid dehydratase
MSEPEADFFSENACSSNGACQYMGTAATMQIMSEALGLSLPTNALMPAWSSSLPRMAESAGRHVLKALESGLTPETILTPEAFENAIMVHAAVSGSTNALLHLPAIAAQIGLEVTPADFDRIHRRIPVLCGLQLSGKWPNQILWFAGGVPGIMREIKDHLHLEAMTVTGKSIGENLEDLERRGFFKHQAKWLENYKIHPRDVIQPMDAPYQPNGGLAVLTGNLAPGGCVIKHAAAASEMQEHTGPARPYDSEAEAVAAIDQGLIRPGDVIVIRYEGPKGSGMPEMFKATETLQTKPELRATVALVTDGRFSGASRGPAVGHLTPEAVDGGPIALVEENDLISISVAGRALNLVGVEGKPMPPEEIAAVLRQRKEAFKPKPNRHTGLLDLFARNTDETSRGASMLWADHSKPRR